MPGVLEPQRPLATIRLPGRSQAAICAVRHEVLGPAAGADAEDSSGAMDEQETRLAVATAEGMLYSFRIELPAAGAAGSGEGSSSSLRHSLEAEWSLAAPGGGSASQR